INVTDRGKKKANLHVTRESRMPGLLTENLFIDRTNDSKKLKKKAFINKLAIGHVNGIVKCFNLKKKKGSTKPKGKLYKVQTGAFSKKSNAVKLVNNLKKDGFDAFIVQTKYYTVQTGAFSKKSNANSMVKKLKKKGYDTLIIREQKRSFVMKDLLILVLSYLFHLNSYDFLSFVCCNFQSYFLMFNYGFIIFRYLFIFLRNIL